MSTPMRLLARLADRLAARRYDRCHARAIAERERRSTGSVLAA